MLSQETMDSIAVMTGIKADVLAQAISDEQEQELELPKGRFLTDENESKLLDNHGKRKYDEGKTKGSKELIETVKTTFELQGDSIDDLLGNFKTNILKDANKEPNEKLTALEQANENLRTSLKGKEDEILTIQTEAEKTRRNAKALSSIPALREDLGLNKSEALNLIMASLEIKEDGVYKDGKLLANEYQEAISFEDAIKAEVERRGWVTKKIQGHGSKKGEPTSATPKSYSDFQKYCESKGWKEGSYEAKQYLGSVKSKNPDFDMDN